VTDPHVRLDVLAATPRIAWIRKPLKLSPRRFRATAACKAERVFRPHAVRHVPGRSPVARRRTRRASVPWPIPEQRDAVPQADDLVRLLVVERRGSEMSAGLSSPSAKTAQTMEI
jgi:hypothetical protein